MPAIIESSILLTYEDVMDIRCTSSTADFHMLVASLLLDTAILVSDDAYADPRRTKSPAARYAKVASDNERIAISYGIRTDSFCRTFSHGH